MELLHELGTALSKSKLAKNLVGVGGFAGVWAFARKKVMSASHFML